VSAATGPIADKGEASLEGCDNCGRERIGAFCHHCGAPKVGGNDLSIRRFAGEAAEELTSLEHSKLFGTLAALLFRPGRLTADYFSGRRIRYLKPLTLVLAVLALHLFAYSVSRTVSMFDIGRSAAMSEKFARARNLPTDGLPSARIDRKAVEEGTSRASVEKEINESWARNVSLSQLPLIILFALVLQLALLGTRRYFSEHLVFSMHFIAFQVLLQILFWPVYFMFGVTISKVTAAIPAIMFIVDIAYLFLAVRLFYGLSAGKALLRATLAFAGYFAIYTSLYVAAMRIALLSVTG
jgi:hypothetical protein